MLIRTIHLKKSREEKKSGRNKRNNCKAAPSSHEITLRPLNRVVCFPPAMVSSSCTGSEEARVSLLSIIIQHKN